jgi:signal transduction histidine kinase
MADTIAVRVGAGINVRIESTAVPCVVHVDPGQFEAAILNMVMNARDAMMDKGELVIRVESMDLIPASHGYPLIKGRFVAVSITDNGSGIAPFSLNRIFEPFFSTKGKGQRTGLGLSQVLGFAKQSGGEIRVESHLGQGSTFTLYLPRP